MFDHFNKWPATYNKSRPSKWINYISVDCYFKKCELIKEEDNLQTKQHAVNIYPSFDDLTGDADYYQRRKWDKCKKVL